MASRVTISTPTKPEARFLATGDMVLLKAPTGGPTPPVCE
jgi:hypothetical protein